jgi:ABC-2 type transport system permease protein
VIAQLRAELRKMATTRTNVGLFLGMIVLILFGVFGGAFNGEADLSDLETQREVVGNGSFAAVFAAMIGVMAMTSEFRHGTIRATFVFTPARGRVVGAKVLASLVVGIAFGALGAGIALGTGTAIVRARGYGVLLDSGDVRSLLLGGIVMSALWAALGVGLGALVRNQVAAIVGLFAWVFVVEILVFQYLPGLGRYAPGAAGTAMTGDILGDSSVDLLSPPVGGLLLAAYAAAFVLVGMVLIKRRDVT